MLSPVFANMRQISGESRLHTSDATAKLPLNKKDQAVEGVVLMVSFSPTASEVE